MPEYNTKMILDDNALRAFYEACGLSPKIIEGAIRQRHEEPLNFAAREKAIAAARATKARRRNSTNDEEG